MSLEWPDYEKEQKEEEKRMKSEGRSRKPRKDAFIDSEESDVVKPKKKKSKRACCFILFYNTNTHVLKLVGLLFRTTVSAAPCSSILTRPTSPLVVSYYPRRSTIYKEQIYTYVIIYHRVPSSS